MPRLIRRDRPLVRPWALAGPLLVLMLAAPLLRPLRSPGMATPAERVTLESVRAILHDGTLALDAGRLQRNDPVLRIDNRTFSQDPPAYDVILAGVGWCIERFGVRTDANPHLFAYLLTLFAITLPTAVAGGLVYRTARVFELRRQLRFGLARATVLATGWFAYATTLQSHALAAAGVMAAIAATVQFAQSRLPGRAVGWLGVAGFCAAGAAVIEPLALWSLVAVLGATLAARAAVRWRVAGVILAFAGAAAPFVLHMTLNTAIVGDWRPPRWHVTNGSHATPVLDEEDDVVPDGWSGLGRGVGRLLTFTVGEHGLLSHFPILLVGLAGAALVVRRHWVGSLKVLAGGTLLALAVTLVYKMIVRPDAIDAGYAAPRLAIFAPVILLWAGAWLRRRHGPVVWTVTLIALVVSAGATLVGAITPRPTDGYSHYTLAEAVERLFE